ncbi:hypothetical protein [Spirosoma radiotolerans]|uniref:Uncharacterized protein n=1 Tax=Spirosoma radiotolerans TaxID=1379870 RepID=A0A0E3V8N2_9BACT|nr:hypothetical protein [Spirosoma radiotolerans]AKD56907.1 hypothetical protein SD10_20330 [Spirosoma radiotolerans]
MNTINKQNKAHLEEQKYRLEHNLANSRKFLAFFESRLPKGYSELSASDFTSDLQSQFAESAYSHKQLIAMLEIYRNEVIKALAPYTQQVD